VGCCGLRHIDGGPEVEILYGISPMERERDYATELARAVLRHGFETTGLSRIRGIADAENGWRRSA